MRVKCLAQEHNTMSPARARTRTARSGDERTNHEATAPPEELDMGDVISVKETLCNDLPVDQQVDGVYRNLENF